MRMKATPRRYSRRIRSQRNVLDHQYTSQTAVTLSPPTVTVISASTLQILNRPARIRSLRIEYTSSEPCGFQVVAYNSSGEELMTSPVLIAHKTTRRYFMRMPYNTPGVYATGSPVYATLALQQGGVATTVVHDIIPSMIYSEPFGRNTI